jgi:hypothetical protein
MRDYMIAMLRGESEPLLRTYVRDATAEELQEVLRQLEGATA